MSEIITTENTIRVTQTVVSNVDAAQQTAPTKPFNWKKLIENVFYPFGAISKAQQTILFVGQVLAIGFLLQTFSSLKPLTVLNEVVGYLMNIAFYDDFLATLMFVIKGMLYAMLITMVLTYLRPIKFFSMLVDFTTKCRYLTFSTVVAMFTAMLHGQDISSLKMVLLLFGVVPFFLTSFIAETQVGKGTPEYQLNKAYVNKKGKWETLYEVVIVGKLDRLFEVVSQNYGIAWAVITAVEANAMNEGGIGTIITKNNRVMNMPKLMAIALLVILLGVLFDFLFKTIRLSLFEYVRKTK